MGLVHVGRGVFVDDEPIEGHPNIYAWVRFDSLESASYGLSLHEPYHERAYRAPELASMTLGRESMENVAPLNDFGEAVRLVQEGARYAFEEYPYVEISGKADYRKILEASGQKATREAAWAGPGVYDMRDRPPTLAWESVEHYEREAMEHAASDVLMMLETEDLGAAVERLAQEAAPRERVAPEPPPFLTGDRIRLVSMPSDPSPLPKGATGTVLALANVGGAFWQVQVDWDNGSRLMLSIPPDRAVRI